jgi:peptidoglycan/LPS O-acetylase OafA/YrhL
MDTGKELGLEERDMHEAKIAHAGARSPAIDVLRGWAVVAVIMLHLNIRVRFSDCALGASLPKPIYSLLFWSGYPAVIVFFVISGFLITRTTEMRWGALQRLEVKTFYRLRFARIAPALLLFVAVQSSLQLARVNGFWDEKPAASLLRTVFSVFTFHMNWLEARFGYLPGAWDVLWSLCIEELFYLGFPLLAVVVKPRLALYVVFAAFAVVGPFARVSFTSNEIWMEHSYLSCMGEIAIGCMAALWIRGRKHSKISSVILFAAGLGMMTLVLFFRRAVQALGLYDLGLNVTVLSLGTAAVLIAVAESPAWSRAASTAALAPLRWLGRNSYEVYLSHMFVVLPATLLFKRLGFPGLIPFFYLAVLLSSALLGAFVARTYSKPLSLFLRPSPIAPRRAQAQPASSTLSA